MSKLRDFTIKYAGKEITGIFKEHKRTGHIFSCNEYNFYYKKSTFLICDVSKYNCQEHNILEQPLEKKDESGLEFYISGPVDKGGLYVYTDSVIEYNFVAKEEIKALIKALEL